MKIFNQFRSELYEEKVGYVGTCVDCFDNDGETINPHLPYRDVSHFAVGEESAKQISKKEFEQQHKIPKELTNLSNKNSTIFLHDIDNDIHMIYDPHNDIHHFFS